MKLFLLHLAFFFFVASSPNISESNIDGRGSRSGSHPDCATCECANGERRCANPYDKCECIHGFLYYKDTDGCPRRASECNTPDWHKHFANNSGCLLCECSQSSCAVGTKCHCRDGVVYPEDDPVNCVGSRQDCFRRPRKKHNFWKMKDVNQRCASCECPNGKQECTGYHAKCYCSEGTLYYKNSSWCAQYEEECDLPDWHKHFANNSECLLCECGQTSCAVGRTCHCRDGVVYQTNNPINCEKSRLECFRRPRRKHHFRHKHFANNSECLLCECGQTSCAVGRTCHCRDGVVYQTNNPINCVRSRLECFRRPRRKHHFRKNKASSGGCAKCECPNGEQECKGYKAKCDCFDGILYYKGSSWCAKNEEDCDRPDWKMKDANQRCASCECPNGKQECTGYHAKCDCFGGTLYYKNSNWCAQYEEKCDQPDWHKHFANYSECLLCECGRTSCAVGTTCHCKDGVVYQTNNPINCVRSRLECFRSQRWGHFFRKNKASSGGCANCECPNGEQECKGYKAKCDCVDGILYYKGSSWCAKNEEDCDRPDWPKQASNNSDCLLCECDKPSCNVGALCHCKDGVLYLKESGMECVRIRRDCFLKHQKKSRF
ncbi:kielin/chordin-like protein isoform X2 [Dermacentor andersoni]|uniref:kielin/chordin-like protein isoform X2 n=1 Tax=Dermacentor andersoni TaxID=34620 RepID=UPI003B3B56EF